MCKQILFSKFQAFSCNFICLLGTHQRNICICLYLLPIYNREDNKQCKRDEIAKNIGERADKEIVRILKRVAACFYIAYILIYLQFFLIRIAC